MVYNCTLPLPISILLNRQVNRIAAQKADLAGLLNQAADAYDQGRAVPSVDLLQRMQTLQHTLAANASSIVTYERIFVLSTLFYPCLFAVASACCASFVYRLRKRRCHVSSPLVLCCAYLLLT